VIGFDFCLCLTKGPSLALCQTATSCRYAINAKIKSNHRAAKGLILAARFMLIDMPALNMIFRGGIIPLWLVRGEIWLLE